MSEEVGESKVASLGRVDQLISQYLRLTPAEQREVERKVELYRLSNLQRAKAMIHELL